MAVWNKIKFFYDTMLGAAGSTLVAASTASGDYSTSYLYNMLETNMWKAAVSTSPQTIDYADSVSHSTDFLAIIGHNLSGVQIDLQFWNGTTYQSVLTFTPANNNAILKEFTAQGAPAWRLILQKTGGFTAPPYMTLCIWGNKTELDYATTSFDPHEQSVKAAVNLSQGGYVTGVHTQYTERSLMLTFEDADATLYSKIKTWWETSGLKNFFVAWENANNLNDVWLMRPDTKFSNPLTNGGIYRNITLNLKGRKE
ncbi:hypothetical protein EPN18_00385 [bacterium]|nr:MAG: hypothetical protein EPN18_00385 [bacterium]